MILRGRSRLRIMSHSPDKKIAPRALAEIIASVLEIDADGLTDDTGPAEVESWDSFRGLLLVSEIEKQFNVSFTIDEVSEVKNVGDIKRVLADRGIPYV